MEDYFTRLIQRVVPKSDVQARGEVQIVRTFLENFSGDNVRYLAESKETPGDYDGQVGRSYRWPLGPVIVISCFNFPLEIPAMQLMGALFMGNKVLVKPEVKTTGVIEEFARMLHDCGLPKRDFDFVHTNGPTFEHIYGMTDVRMTQFTGSSRVAERLATVTRGKIKLEDSGFDWKILGPDVMNVDYVAYQCDQDAYALSGQKCSAQKFLLVHKNWKATPFYDRIAQLAARRSLKDLTISPVLTVTNETFLKHRDDILQLPGARVLFGGNLLTGHKIPPRYGAWQPTAIFVPLKHFADPRYFPLLTTEIFGPFQIVTEYDDAEIPTVLETFERIPMHLTAAVVSNDIPFRHKILSNTVNGTTYQGYKGRTTGTPQFFWFGPSGDPRGAGIGTREAITQVWSVHRGILCDDLPIPANWRIPPPS